MVEYRIESRSDSTPISKRFTGPQIAVLEKLNRASSTRLDRLPQLVVPGEWRDESLYSPFPDFHADAARTPQMLIVDVPWQAFAAYEWGRLVRWGPVSSGRRDRPTPSGLFHLNWKSRGRHSTLNPEWYLRWYFNFHNFRGLALHEYPLPGYPASHACVRLLARDAAWIYDWGEGWTLDADGQVVVVRGTPLLIVGEYAFGSSPPWRSLAHLARGIELPNVALPVNVQAGS